MKQKFAVKIALDPSKIRQNQLILSEQTIKDLVYKQIKYTVDKNGAQSQFELEIYLNNSDSQLVWVPTEPQDNMLRSLGTASLWILISADEQRVDNDIKQQINNADKDSRFSCSFSRASISFTIHQVELRGGVKRVIIPKIEGSYNLLHPGVYNNNTLERFFDIVFASQKKGVFHNIVKKHIEQNSELKKLLAQYEDCAYLGLTLEFEHKNNWTLALATLTEQLAREKIFDINEMERALDDNYSNMPLLIQPPILQHPLVNFYPQKKYNEQTLDLQKILYKEIDYEQVLSLNENEIKFALKHYTLEQAKQIASFPTNVQTYFLPTVISKQIQQGRLTIEQVIEIRIGEDVAEIVESLYTTEQTNQINNFSEAQKLFLNSDRIQQQIRQNNMTVDQTLDLCSKLDVLSRVQIDGLISGLNPIQVLGMDVYGIEALKRNFSRSQAEIINDFTMHQLDFFRSQWIEQQIDEGKLTIDDAIQLCNKNEFKTLNSVKKIEVMVKFGLSYDDVKDANNNLLEKMSLGLSLLEAKKITEIELKGVRAGLSYAEVEGQDKYIIDGMISFLKADKKSTVSSYSFFQMERSQKIWPSQQLINCQLNEPIDLDQWLGELSSCSPRFKHTL